MAGFRDAKLREQFTTSRVRPTRQRVVQKQFVSARHGATVSELIEDQIKTTAACCCRLPPVASLAIDA